VFHNPGRASQLHTPCLGVIARQNILIFNGLQIAAGLHDRSDYPTTGTNPFHFQNASTSPIGVIVHLQTVAPWPDNMIKAQFVPETSEAGEFQRQEDAFREWISADGSTPFPAVAGRYHLYISLACPWASRTLIVRNLKGLQDAIGLTIVDPVRDEKGWAFRDPSGKISPGAPFESTDPVNGFHYLREAYAATDPNFDERVTVPVLWDKETKKIVNNCEDDLCRMFNDAFGSIARN